MTNTNPPITIPNMLTWGRIVLIPVFVVIFYLPYTWSHLFAAVIFVIAAITDFFDGYLARKLNQSTRMGAFLDPVADKLMVAVALVLLVELHASKWLVIPALVIVCREILVSALREWMAEVGKRAAVAVGLIGKIKTTVQMIAITALLVYRPEFQPNGKLILSTELVMAYLLLYLATFLTMWSAYLYLQAAWPELQKAGEDDK